MADSAAGPATDEQLESARDEARSAGTVKWFNPKKGYGFITPEEGEEEVFVHQSDIEARGFRSLAEGSQVEYTPLRSDDNRLKASKVTGPGGSPVKIGPKPALPSRTRRGIPQHLPMPYAMMYHRGYAGYPPAAGDVYPGMYAAAGQAGLQQGVPPGMMQGLPAPYASPSQAGAMAGGPPAAYAAQGGFMYAGAMPAGMMMAPRPMGAPGGRPRSPWRVVVHNLPWEIDDAALHTAFQMCNPTDATVMKDRRTGNSNGVKDARRRATTGEYIARRGYGIVEFMTEGDMHAAISMHGTVIGDPGREVSVRQDQYP